MAESTCYDAALKAVADFRVPTGMVAGRYHTKCVVVVVVVVCFVD
jgi:phenolic acid decarboxylase